MIRRTGAAQPGTLALGRPSTRIGLLHQTGMWSERLLFSILCPDAGSAALVADPDCLQLHYANGKGRRFLLKGGAVTAPNGFIRFANPAVDHRLRSEIARLKDNAPVTQFVTWPELESIRLTAITMRLIEGSSRAHAFGPYLVMEFREDSCRLAAEWVRSFAAAFSLSPSETDLVLSLAHNVPLEAMAKDRNVAVSTLRQRMKSVLQKTHCRRQCELLCLMLSLAAGRADCPPNLTAVSGRP